MNEMRSRWMALTALTALALFLCWRLVQPFMDVLVWSVVLVIIVYPLKQWIDRKTMRPWLSTILSIALLILGVLLPISLLTVAVVSELRSLTYETQVYVKATMADPVKAQKARALLDTARRYVNVDQLLSPDSLRSMAAQASNVVVKGTMSIVGGAIGIVAKICMILFTTFYLLRDARPALARLIELLPLHKSDAEGILKRTGDIILASVFGVLAIAVAQGVLGGLMFWWLGLPSALVWGTVMAVLSIVPLIGCSIVWVPAAVFLALTGHWIKAVVLLIWGLTVISSVDSVIRPHVVGSRTHMHDLIVFFTVLGGLQVFGILGVVLGPVIVAVTLALFDVFRLGEKHTIRVVKE